MRYQVVKQLKTKNRTVAVFGSLAEADDYIRKTGATFVEFTYYGGFPVYADTVKKTVYSIQGLADIGVVCSLNESELKAFNFAQ